MELNESDVFQILKFIDESKFNELHLEMGDLKLIVHKRDVSGVVEAPAPAPVPYAKSSTFKNTDLKTIDQKATSLTSVESNEDVQIKALDSADVFEEEGLIPIKSPMLGTFYTAPKPGDPPFVKVGTVVGDEDTVCIIEVMKLFTSITAGVRGCITRICADEGQMVQYDQVLFLVKPQNDLGESDKN